MEPEDRVLLQKMAGKISAIDERTTITHGLLTSRMQRDDVMHDQMHSRINGLSRTVYLGGGGLAITMAAAGAWLRSVFTTGGS